MADHRIDPQGIRPGYPLSKLGQSGATSGQVPVWNATTGQWEPGSASGGGVETLPASIIDAKGDLIVGTANDTATRKAVGANATSLVADSTQTGGVKWENRVKSLTAGVGASIDNTDPLNPIISASPGVTSFAGIILPTAGTLFQPPYNLTTTSTTTTTAGLLRMYPFPLTSAMTIVSMIASLSSTTGSTAVIWLGIYDSDPVTYAPKNLVINAGSVTNSAVGNRTATLGTPVTLQPGFYWMAHLPDVAAGTWTAMVTGMVLPILGPNTRLDASGVAAGGLPSTAPTMTPGSSGVAGLKTWVST